MLWLVRPDGNNDSHGDGDGDGEEEEDVKPLVPPCQDHKKT